MKVQRGFSLIEVLVGLAIGIVLILGITTFFGSMRQTSIWAQQLSQIQNQQRMAMYFLHTAVSNTGYYSGVGSSTPPKAIDPAIVFPASATEVIPYFASAGQSLVGSGTGGTVDTISVRFIASASSSLQGCSASLTVGNRYIDTFSVSGDFLQCVETNETTGVTSAAVNLIAGLSGMTILYGVDATGNDSVTTSPYLSATDVTTGGYWPVATFDNPASGSVSGVKTVQVTWIFTNPLATDSGQLPTVQLTETIPYMANI